jgi:hypothetical protein
VPDLPVSEFARGKLKVSADELRVEKEAVSDLLS